MFIIVSIIVLVTMFLVIWKISSLQWDYFKEKVDIMRIISSFLSDVKVDKTDKSINPINLENTKNNILYFSKRLLKMQKLYFYNKKMNNDFDENEDEKRYLLEVLKLFNEWLNNWLDFHKNELENLTESLQDQEQQTKNIAFKSALDLQRNRIYTYSQKI